MLNKRGSRLFRILWSWNWKTFHKEPNVLHYVKKELEKIKSGMIFTIEPMIDYGGYETKILNDGWTAVTKENFISTI